MWILLLFNVMLKRHQMKWNNMFAALALIVVVPITKFYTMLQRQCIDWWFLTECSKHVKNNNLKAAASSQNTLQATSTKLSRQSLTAATSQPSQRHESAASWFSMSFCLGEVQRAFCGETMGPFMSVILVIQNSHLKSTQKRRAQWLIPCICRVLIGIFMLILSGVIHSRPYLKTTPKAMASKQKV